MQVRPASARFPSLTFTTASAEHSSPYDLSEGKGLQLSSLPTGKPGTTRKWCHYSLHCNPFTVSLSQLQCLLLIVHVFLQSIPKNTLFLSALDPCKMYVFIPILGACLIGHILKYSMMFYFPECQILTPFSLLLVRMHGVMSAATAVP